MTKLDKAITRLRLSEQEHATQSGKEVAQTLAEALEEIRDRIAPEGINMDQWMRSISQTIAFGQPVEQPTPTDEQPATFEPWDCVKAKPGTELYRKWADAEMCLGSGPDEDGYYRVFNPDYDGMLSSSASYVGPEDLIFVRRLKPRTQAEPTFKAGEYVRNIFDIESFVYEVMQDTNGPRVQLRDCTTGQPIAFDADDLRKIDKPAPFQVGDWVHDNEDDFSGEVELIFDQGKRVRIKGDLSYYSRSVKYLTKIPAPAPRFTFGDRVRVAQHGPYIVVMETDTKDVWRLISEHCDTFTAHTTDLTLDTSTD